MAPARRSASALLPTPPAALLATMLPAILLAAAPAAAQNTMEWPRGTAHAYPLDSDGQDNDAAAPAVVFRATVHLEGSAWMRLYFARAMLGPGSTVVMTARLDGQRQELDAAGLAMWGNTSAYFNGDTVELILVAGPKTAGNRVVLDHVTADRGEADGAGGCGICGDDDRVPSNEDFSARLLPAGCSATVWNTESCIISAGHCVRDNSVIEFRVPPSNGDCTINHPPVDDQFPIIETLFANGGPGNDWSVMRTGTNGLVQTPYDRFGAFLPIRPNPVSEGVTATVFGYGVDTPCERSQVQQTSSGTIRSVLGNRYLHDIDTTGGNSGSCLVVDGRIIGVATHCACPNNVATRVDHPDFRAARDQLCPCLGDADGNGVIDFGDILKILANWGQSGVPADTNDDGTVDFADILFVLTHWGPC